MADIEIATLISEGLFSARPAAADALEYWATDTQQRFYSDGVSWSEQVPPSAGGGAPTTADYLVGTAQGGLSAEIVVGTTPGGELGGTWASPTVDATHSGSTHAAAQAAAEATAASALASHEADTTSIHGITNTANLYAVGGADVALTDGGTGASSASGARTNLGLVIGTDVAAQTHATQHKSGGSDAVKLDELAAPTDITTLNASTSAHGLTPKLDNNSAHFLNGQGGWTTPGGVTGMTNPMTTTGDIIYSSDGSGTPARLAIGGATTFLKGGTTPAYAVPPGAELDYVEFTSSVNVSATTEGTANTIVTGTSISLDGSTSVIVEFFAPQCRPAASATAQMIYVLFDGATVLGGIGVQNSAAANNAYEPIVMKRRLATPSAASHQYIVKAYVTTGTGVVAVGAGGTGVNVPGYIRVTKV